MPHTYGCDRWLGPLKFSLQATIDPHGPSIDSGHYTASINCCKKHSIPTIIKITEFGITDKNSSTAYIILCKWIDTWFLDSNRRMGLWSLPWRWHILSIPLTTGRGTSAETCGLDDVFLPDDLGSRPEFCYRSYIQRECHSVLAKLHPITFYRIVFLGSARFLGWMPLFVFFGLPVVSCSLIKVWY